MEHGIIITDGVRVERFTVVENILLSSFDAPLPAEKLYQVEIDGRNGAIDYTDYFGVTYKNRPVTATLNINKAFGYAEQLAYHSLIATKWHGKRVKLYHWAQPYKYYYGRLSVGEITNGVFSLSLDAEPFAYIAKGKEYTVTATATEQVLQVVNIGKALYPKITIDGNVTIKVNDVTLTLETGEYQIIDIQLNEAGTTDITYSGNGTLIIEYQERVL